MTGHGAAGSRAFSAGAAEIHASAQIAASAVIGRPFRPLLDGRRLTVSRAAAIGADVWIGEFTTIGAGAIIGAGSIIEDYVGIEAASELGERVLVTSRSFIGLNASIGDDCVIKGYVGDNSKIGAGCRIAGDLIHRQLDPSLGWDDPAAEEPAPIIGDRAFVGWRAVIVGGVNIGAGAYVCAGALITKDVPAGFVACNRNEHVHPGAWPGALGKSPFFKDQIAGAVGFSACGPGMLR